MNGYLNEYLYNSSTLLRSQDFPSQYNLPDLEVSTINQVNTTAANDTGSGSYHTTTQNTTTTTTVANDMSTPAVTVPSTMIAAAVYLLIIDIKIPDTLKVLSRY